jgi:four helix bundle protein
MSDRPRSYEQWLTTLPSSLTSSPVWQMSVYREAAFLLELAWHDTRKLIPYEDMLPVRRQIFHAVGSIGANIAEGFGRNSANDRRRFYEYALTSGDEAQLWYMSVRYILGDSVYFHRSELIASVACQLVALIPKQRNLRENDPEYFSADE